MNVNDTMPLHAIVFLAVISTRSRAVPMTVPRVVQVMIHRECPFLLPVLLFLGVRLVFQRTVVASVSAHADFIFMGDVICCRDWRSPMAIAVLRVCTPIAGQKAALRLPRAC